MVEELGLTRLAEFERQKEFYGKWFKRWYETPDKGLHYYLRMHMYKLAIDGDQSFANRALADVQRRLLDGVPLDEADQWFLAMVISRVAHNSVAINSICGTEAKRGAGKRGYRGWVVAHKVMTQLRSGETTVENAIAEVADSEHLSQSMVKRYWRDWKTDIAEVYALEDHFAAHPEARQQKS